MLPFRDGSPGELAAVRDLFAAAGYTAPRVSSRLGVPNVHKLKTIGKGRTTAVALDDPLDLLIRIFIDAVPVPAETLERLLPKASREVLLALGLIAPHPRVEGHYAATVRLYPIDGLYIVSDLEVHAPGVASLEELEPPDQVFPALTPLTGTFLAQLPSTPCHHFLELCAGTGIAALEAARFADQSWAVDITERSTRFAEFNIRLNGLDNVQALCGDLYDPVQGMTFDRIVAHPPYVPATENRLVFRDGGRDGEDVIRRILAGLPDHLAPGGRFYLTCVATDRKDAPLEQRFRQMLGEREGEFDLLLVSHYAMPPLEYYGRAAGSGRIPFETAGERVELLTELGVERVVYASTVLQRHTLERSPFTVRRERTEAADSPETEWLMGWLTRVAEEDVLPALLESRPRLLPHAHLEVAHRVEAGEWKMESSRLRLEYPFIRTVEMSFNAAMLLTLCNGEHTVRQILQHLQERGALSPEVPPLSFAEFIRELVTEGVLGIGGEPSPRPGAEPATPASAAPPSAAAVPA